MKTLKQTIAILLTAILLLGMAPFCAFAESGIYEGPAVAYVEAFDVQYPKYLGNGLYEIPKFTYRVTFTDGTTLTKTSTEKDENLSVSHNQEHEPWSLDNWEWPFFTLTYAGYTTSVPFRLYDPNYSLVEEKDGVYISYVNSGAVDKNGTVTIPSKIAGRTIVGIYSITGSAVNVVLPSTIKKIGADTFRWAESLKTISVSSENKYFSASDGVLYDKAKTKLICIPAARTTTVTIPKTVKNIDAIVNSTNAPITIASGSSYFVKSNHVIYNKAKTKIYFADKTLSGTYTMPSTVSSIADAAFANCNKLTKVVCSNKVTNIAYYSFADCTTLKEIQLPNKLTSIKREAFMGCTNLAKVNLPSTVKTIEENAFMSCSALKTINLPSSLTELQSKAFKYSGLTQITIPNKITSLYWSTFEQCEQLTQLNIGSGLRYLCDVNLRGNPKLKEIYVSSSNKYFSSENGILYDKNKETVLFVPPAKGPGVKLSSKVKTINYNAYYNNVAKTIKIPNSVTSIAYLTFCDSALTSVTLPTNLKKIARYTFMSCENLVSVTIPKSVKTIGGSAFDYCYKLKHVYYAGTKAQWDAISIEDWGNDALKKATIHYNSKGCTHKYSAGADLSCNVCGYFNIEPTSKQVNGKWYYYNNGVRQTSFTGMVTIGGKARFIKKGVVTSNLDQPTVKLAVTTSGVKLTWNKVAAATGYKVYRSVYSNGKWSDYKLYAKTTKTSYENKSLKNGARVRYTVYAYNSTHSSKFKTGVVTTYFAPRTATVKKVSSGIKISWTKAAGAKGYAVYRREYKNGKWSALKLIKKTTATTYTNASAKKGVKYQYVVRAYNGNYYSAIKYSASIKR